VARAIRRKTDTQHVVLPQHDRAFRALSTGGGIGKARGDSGISSMSDDWCYVTLHARATKSN